MMTQEQIEAKQAALKQRQQEKAEQARLVEQAFLSCYPSALPAGVDPELVIFRHDTYVGKTYAVLPPSKTDLSEAVSKLLRGEKEVGITLSVGVATLNAQDRDHYSRPRGRAVALSKMAPALFKLTAAHVNEERASYFTSLGGLHFGFYLSHGKDNPFLDYVTDDSATSYADRMASLASRGKSI